ncbi:hypothetical protein [Bradyrhizobium sp. NBAIM14]|uniref:hypothetical protein n=1 Tax=Bradyrhizobium sp. NBAIM14 TaxID=2793814 RepID=UPI001CD74F48|nr:hypothetical protein [Bradyrhizobium sp. NBAIM14]MCA1500133.1 hypothetical protein [Bradyrhizobium sp. NBAIM14]
MVHCFGASFVVLVLIMALSIVYVRRPQSTELYAAAMPSLIEMHDRAGVHGLSDDNLDDQALVFPGKPE